jgi:hypothetical protein
MKLASGHEPVASYVESLIKEIALIAGLARSLSARTHVQVLADLDQIGLEEMARKVMAIMFIYMSGKGTETAA